MTAAEIAQLAGLRERRDGEYEGPCPACGGRPESKRYSVVDRSGRTLMTCRAGCETADILAALGVGWSDLFRDPHPSRPDPEVARRRHAEAVLCAWRAVTLAECCKLIRHAEMVVAAASDALRLDEHNEAAWAALSTAYHGQTSLECDFTRLSGSDRGQWLQLYRERRHQEGHNVA